MNNNIGTSGRLGNHFFRNIVANFLASNNDLNFKYSYLNEFTKLGIANTFYYGSKTYNINNTIMVTNKNVMKLINNKVNLKTNYNLSNDYFQLPETALLIREWCCNNPQMNNIINSNPYKERYKNNDDVFIHVRLDDARAYAQSFEYFDSILQKLTFNKVFISSDSINDFICVKLIKKYNMEIINKNEIETIQFASTCKNIILSTGTFSWMIGILSFYSIVYYPKRKKIWHGDIFIFPEWKEINW